MTPALAAAAKNLKIAAVAQRNSRPLGFVKILITCGPASEAIDSVRRVTNHSTGALGTQIAESFAAVGHDVLCLRGTAATAPPPPLPVVVQPFFGNSELQGLLQKEAEKHDVVLHLAALADFVPYQVRNGEITFPAGQTGKIRSDAADLAVYFRRAPKLISQLRLWFPYARIVGWKYEVEGPESAILDLGKRQIIQNNLDATVLNGPALGQNLIYLPANGAHRSFPNRQAFVDFLTTLPEFESSC